MIYIISVFFFLSYFGNYYLWLTKSCDRRAVSMHMRMAVSPKSSAQKGKVSRKQPPLDSSTSLHTFIANDSILDWGYHTFKKETRSKQNPQALHNGVV
jgi:hypothetical protein